jgi:uncharacterized protein YbjT (DUF2867 family)
MGKNVKKILLTGVSGYIGGRLLKVLEKEKWQLRALVRDLQRFAGRTQSNTEVIQGDVLKKETLIEAMQGVDVAFYLVHSMASLNFSDQDRLGAANFAQAAQTCGVKKIIYLGGLVNTEKPLSAHLQSRQEVGDILRQMAQGVQVIEFRASIIIGSGSLSFELIRALSERLPIMVTPKWVHTLSQPISIVDVLSYLKKAIDIEVEGNPIFEIGGKDRLSYGDIMQEYCRQRQLRRWMISVPFLTPWLSSLWLGLVTPLYAQIGRKLIESACCPTLVQDDSAKKFFGVNPMGIEESIALSLANEDQEFAQTHWSDAFSSTGPQKNNAGVRFGNRLIDTQEIEVAVDPEKAFSPIQRIGGKVGWYYADYLWGIRGFLDRLLGGIGLRRGRRDPHDLRVGDAIDFWRVEVFESNRRLLLYAEMKLPGRAWLEFTVSPSPRGSLIKQHAIFDPIGVTGLLYWYSFYPLHYFIFRGMISKIAKAAEKQSLQS